ncbi:MAG: aminotransferase [Pseudomonadota bacterium]
MRNYDVSALITSDLAHHIHPFTDHDALRDDESLRIITRAEGVYIYDGYGNQILDGMSGLWCVNIGYGEKRLIDACSAQMQDLPYYNTFFKTATPPPIALAERLAELLGAPRNHVFFGSSGSESNDTVIRIIRRYWQCRGEENRNIIISRHNAYHGSTLGGLTLGGMKPMHTQAALTVPGIEHIDQPYWFAAQDNYASEEEFGRVAASWLEDRILALGTQNVAAFIGEPVQGAGGVVIPPKSYWPEIARICKKYGILLVSDEVICGFGRTGSWFGFQTFDFQPDIVTMAKGISSGYLPLSAVAVSDTIKETISDSEFAHGYTYSGHPVCCAVGLENINLIDERGMVDAVKNTLAPHFAKALAGLRDHAIVGEVRTLGLLSAIELVKDKKTRARYTNAQGAGVVCRDECFKAGLVSRAVGDTMVMAPPLCITKSQIDEIAAKMRIALDRTHARLQA